VTILVDTTLREAVGGWIELWTLDHAVRGAADELGWRFEPA
jgi:hypothetical protein